MQIDKRVKESLAWLISSQDTVPDDGFASHYERGHGWHSSYPEVTGYIIPTLLKYSKVLQDDQLRKRAIRATNWLLSIQNKTGSFQGRLIDEQNPTPVVFNTGMIIFGLLSAYDETGFGSYLRSASSAGDWLVKIQDDNGAWTKFNTVNGDCLHNYHSRVAWALLELYKRTSEEKYLFAATKNLKHCMASQRTNGWFSHTSLTKDMQNAPLLHFIAYTIRGTLECGLFLNDEKLIAQAILSATEIKKSFEKYGNLFGRYEFDWSPACEWECLTGSFQISIIFAKIGRVDQSTDWHQSARKIFENALKVSRKSSCSFQTQGAVPGSFPLEGPYMQNCFLSWATKFLLDSYYELEMEVYDAM